MDYPVIPALSPEEKAEAFQCIGRLSELLGGKGQAPTVSQLKSLTPMGDSGRSIVEKAILVVRRDDSLLSRRFSVPQYENALLGHDQYEEIEAACQTLADRAAAFKRCDGSACMEMALDVAHNAQRSDLVEGLDDLRMSMDKRYPGSPRKANRKSRPTDDGSSSGTPSA